MGARQRNGARKPARTAVSRLLLQRQETARVRRLLEQARESSEVSELESELLNRLSDNEQELEARDARIAELEGRLAAVADAEKTLAEQRASMAKLQQEAQAWMMGEKESYLGAVQRELDASRAAEAALQVEMARHVARVEEVEKRLRSELSEQEALLLREQEATRAAQASANSSAAQVREMENDLGTLQSDLSSAQERLAELERALQEVPGRVLAEARETFELEKQPLIEQQATLMATLADESAKRRDLEAQLARANDLSAQLEKLTPIQRERDEARDELEKVRADITRLGLRIAELEQLVLDVEARGKSALEREIEANDRVMIKMEDEIAARDRRIAELGG